MPSNSYYQKVADFYDHEACSYEERYWRNVIAQRIRQSFREEVKACSFVNVLEIGCGTGMDTAHFGAIYPERKIYGIDIAPAMVASAGKKIHDQSLGNVRVAVGAPEDLEALFPGVQFDHVYVFFGALNTVADLRGISRILKNRIRPNGTMVLTFVNKWYLFDMLVDLLKLRFKRAFSRAREIWGGYSDVHQIESRCFSPRQIRRAFGEEFLITHTRGYSILYPAWYRVHLLSRLGSRVCNFLWQTDRLLSRTPAWSLGEYALYTFKVKG